MSAVLTRMPGYGDAATWNGRKPAEPDDQGGTADIEIAAAMKTGRALERVVPDFQGVNRETKCTPFDVVTDALGFDAATKAVLVALLNTEHPLVAQLRKTAGDYHARTTASDIDAHRNREYY